MELTKKKRMPKEYTEKDLQTDTKMTGYSWRELEIKAQDRRLRKTVVSGLCPRRDDGHKTEEEIKINISTIILCLLCVLFQNG